MWHTHYNPYNSIDLCSKDAYKYKYVNQSLNNLVFAIPCYY